MDIEIKKLTPEHLEDYLYFFENVAHSDNPNEDRCYCVCWCSDDHRNRCDFQTPEGRRVLAEKYVKSGILQGYLAYYNNEIVGWCNANTKADCTQCISWLNQKKDIKITEQDKSVKSIFCFAIAPKFRQQGIATKLLEKVCIDAAIDGYSFVEAYPFKNHWYKKFNVFNNFYGPKAMYSKLGFVEIQKFKYNYVLSKKLN